jgi:hypothetical protein
VSLPNPKVIAAVNSVVTAAFSGILFNFFYRNRSSNYIIIPYRSTTVDTLIGWVYRYRIVNNVIIITGRVVA